MRSPAAPVQAPAGDGICAGADYNVAPTKHVGVVVFRRPDGEPDSDPVPSMQAMRWGLVPRWADNPAIGNRLINARAETAAEKPSFRAAFAFRRCLIPADGYYEWYGDPGTGRRQPYFIHPRGGGVLAMAGLYELWRDPTRADDHPAAWLWTCVILTTAAADDLAWLHDRMPAVIERKDFGTWLDPRTDPSRLQPLLEPSRAVFDWHPVTPAVGDARVNGPHLIDPVEVEQTPTQEPLF